MVPFFIAARNATSGLSTGSAQLTPNPDFAGPDFKLTWLLAGMGDIPRHGRAVPAAGRISAEQVPRKLQASLPQVWLARKGLDL
jgi:hypothetical protein